MKISWIIFFQSSVSESNCIAYDAHSAQSPHILIQL